ncbi:MAG: hypothetical protein V4649_12400 [Bacteroidota bacterium]
MKTLLIHIRSLLIVLGCVFGAALPAIAGGSANDSLLTRADYMNNFSTQTMNMYEGPVSSVMMVAFGAMIIYASYRYWADNSKQKAD